jgi:hypothetical protein
VWWCGSVRVGFWCCSLLCVAFTMSQINTIMMDDSFFQIDMVSCLKNSNPRL